MEVAEDSPPRLVMLLRYLLLACGLFYLAMFLFVAVSRIGYRFELEWVEGNSVDTVVRFLTGLPIYAQPTMTFIANVYSPLYFYVSALASMLLGIGFFPLRLVSLLSTLGSFAIIWIWVRRESGDAYAGMLSACLFAATFALGGAWFDLARTDMLFILLYLWAAFTLRFAKKLSSYLLAVFLIFLAFFSKQSALMVLLPLFIFSLINNWKYALISIGVLGGLILGSTIFLNQVYNGWYSYYVFYLPARFAQQIDWKLLSSFWFTEFSLPLGIALALSIVYLIFQFRGGQRAAWFYLMLLTGVILGTLPSRLSLGSYVNRMIPIYAAMSVTFGLGFAFAMNRIGVGKTIGMKRAAQFVLYALCIAQFGLLLYDPLPFIPTAADTEAGEHFVALLRQMPDGVYMPAHSYLPTLAGKPSHAHTTCLHVVMNSDPGPVKQRLVSELADAMNQKTMRTIIMDSKVNMPGYAESGMIFDRDDVFWTRSGERTRPNFIYQAK